jgi:3'-phosphoadenosine 5'-phosphosulfate sulfotransferase (PAPS reductase)/FAD synthetase
MTRVIAWVSAGAASAIAAKLAIAKYGDDVVLAYCETGGEHPDNERFLADLVRWYNLPITRLKSEEYESTWEVWEGRDYLSGINGAPCTEILKIAPRLKFQRPGDIHVFGYTSDKRDVVRANRLRLNYPDMAIETPLIDGGLDKLACLAMVENAGIEIPVLYKLGFPNNNCIPCVKATSPDYWSLVRLRFPAEFDRVAALARKLDVRLCRIKDERRFIDEIPADWPTLNPLVPSCDFLCGLAEMGLQQ